MKLAIAGTGYVGLVTAVCMAEIGHNVTCVDIDERKIALLKQGISPINEQDLEHLMAKNKERLIYTSDYINAYKNAEAIFIGVGTPEQEDGSANLTYVRIVAKQIAKVIENDCVVVVKSTVPIGTNDEIEKYIAKHLKNKITVHVVSNPEFLAQGTAVYDTLHAKRIVIGTENEKAKIVMEQIYRPFNLPIIFTNRRSAEMIKYAANDFLALKISYVNELANLCELVGADILDVTKGMGYDPRIGDKFLNAGIGYGGSCFPKDTKALYHFAKNQYSYEMKTIKAAIDVNATQKSKLFFKARQRFTSFDGRHVTLLGLTFKPGTDDLRESPAFEMISLLLKDGAIIHVYDPVGMENMKRHYPQELDYCQDASEAVKKGDLVFVLTEWKEFSELPAGIFKDKVVYDGRNCMGHLSGIVDCTFIGRK